MFADSKTRDRVGDYLTQYCGAELRGGRCAVRQGSRLTLRLALFRRYRRCGTFGRPSLRGSFRRHANKKLKLYYSKVYRTPRSSNLVGVLPLSKQAGNTSANEADFTNKSAQKNPRHPVKASAKANECQVHIE